MKRNRIFVIGLYLFLVANLSTWYLAHHNSAEGTISDGMAGLLYGFAIGMMLLGMIVARRGSRCASDDSSTPAPSR